MTLPLFHVGILDYPRLFPCMRRPNPSAWTKKAPAKQPFPPSTARKAAMPRFPLTLAAVLGGLLASAADSPEPFAISLEVRSGDARMTAHAESAAPDAKPKERAVLEVKAGDRVTVQWKLNGTDPKAKIEDVTVHFFAVKEETAGQRVPAKLDKGVIAESALSMDFGPGDKNEGELNFIIDKPGCYLFRVETIGAAAGAADHEDFAALDVNAR